MATSSLNIPKAHQELVIASFMKDQYMYSISKDSLDDTYFSNPECKIIYRSISAYYNKYRIIPEVSELLVIVNDYYSEGLGTDINKVKDEIIKLDQLTLPDNDLFIKEKIIDLIRRVRTGNALSNIYNKVKSNSSLDGDDVAKELYSSMEVDLDEIEVYNLSDTQATIKSREEALGTDTSPKIIKSLFNEINDNLLYGGYQPGTLTMIVAAPGCFTEDTKILTPAGSVEISSMISRSNPPHKYAIYGYDPNNQSVIRESYSSVRLSKYTKDLIRIEFSKVSNNTQKYLSSVKCTPDHPFMIYSGEYVQAKDLTPGIKLMGVTRNSKLSDDSELSEYIIVTKVESMILKEEVPVYGIVDAGNYGNYALALDDELGCIVHNTGKTTWLISEGAHAALQGYSVLHVFIGDMKKYDAFVRYSANISRQCQNNIAMLNGQQIEGLINMTNQTHQDALSRIDILAYNPGTKTADQLVELIQRVERKLSKNYDMIIIDYPENLKRDHSMSLYSEGGDIYDKLVHLFWVTQSVGLVASQPKIQYWSSEIIPLEGASESSKKQHAADNIITMGLPYKGSEVGSLFLAKVRRGNDGVVIRFKKVFSESRFEVIPEATYRAHLQSLKGSK